MRVEICKNCEKGRLILREISWGHPADFNFEGEESEVVEKIFKCNVCGEFYHQRRRRKNGGCDEN